MSGRTMLKGTAATIFLLLLGALSGCANSNLGELRGFVDAEKAKLPGRIESLPEIKQITTFVYESEGRRDPFVPMEGEEQRQAGAGEGGIKPDFNRRREELEGYALDAIRMVGTLQQTGVMWGLVKTKEGTIHRVRNGNYMGQNHGRIIQITEEKIDLTEIVQDGTGGYSERQASIALAE